MGDDWLLGQAGLGLSGQGLGALGSYAQQGQCQGMSAAQQGALNEGIMRGSSSLGLNQALHTTPTISKKEFKDQKIKYSEFKKCGNPIKQSEFTYRG